MASFALQTPPTDGARKAAWANFFGHFSRVPALIAQFYGGGEKKRGNLSEELGQVSEPIFYSRNHRQNDITIIAH